MDRDPKISRHPGHGQSLHIMGGCPWVLNVENKTTPSEDRYTWRHNNVLRVLCNAIVRKVQQRNQDSQKDTAPGIHFVKEKATASTISSAKTNNKKKTFYGHLATSNDWTVFFELPELKAFSINTFLKIFAKLQNKLILLSYLKAKRFVLLAQNSRFQLKRGLPFGTRKKQENMRK